MNIRSLVTLSAALLLAACATPPPAQRHSPAQIARYEPGQFSTPVASLAGTQKARAEALAGLALALDGRADDEGVAAALRAVAFYQLDTAAAVNLLQRVLSDAAQPLPQKPVDFQRAVLTAAYTLDAGATAPQLRALLPQLQPPREFAIAAYALLRADPGNATRQRLLAALSARADHDEPRLRALQHVLEGTARAPAPPLAELLAAPLQPGLPVIFSLQRQDRRYPGLAVVRDGDGRFVRGGDGQPFAVPHLDRKSVV